MNIDELRQKIEDLDFGIYDETFSDGSVGMELSQFTPMGQDWNFYIEYDGSVESFMENLKEYERNFDVDEEAKFFISQMGEFGIPDDAEGLLEDAKWKKKQLEDLVATLEGLDLEECNKVEEQKVVEGKLNFIENVDELPDMCYGVLPSDNSIIIIKKGEKGYYETDYTDMVEGESYDERYKSANDVVNKLNAEIDITPDQRFTMEIRSMNGNWKSKSTESKKLEEEISNEVIECAKSIADKVKEVGIMNFTDVDAMIQDILGLSYDDIKAQDIANDVYGCMTWYNGLGLNYSTGDFYTEEYAEKHPEIKEESLEEEKKIKKETITAKHPIKAVLEFFGYDDIFGPLEQLKNGTMTEQEVIESLKSLNPRWQDEDAKILINDYKENYMEEKPEPTPEEKADKIQNTKIREWYMDEYPTDELGEEIREGLTFYDLYEAMDNYMDVYNVLNVNDSIVRERVFSELADLMDVDYDYIYQQWLKTKDDTTEEEVVEFLKQSHPKTEDRKAKGIKGKITEVEDVDLDETADEEESNELDEIIEEHKSKSPMHEAIISEILDDIDNYDGETKLDKLKAKLDDVFTGPINDGGINSLIYYSDTCNFYNTYETDIEDIIFDMQDGGLEPLETLRASCDDAEIIMQEDNVKNKIVEMVYSEVLYQLELAIEEIGEQGE